MMMMSNDWALEENISIYTYYSTSYFVDTQIIQIAKMIGENNGTKTIYLNDENLSKSITLNNAIFVNLFD